VKKLNPDTDEILAEELLKRVKEFNYVPTKKSGVYAQALVAEFKKQQW
jgi:hypothetical protein